jgi:antitoxin (DNA-binding transcriptional repressor) of toxin-antitoxin stability system
MREVTIRELYRHGGRLLDQVLAGEELIIFRDGRPVTELRPLRAVAATGPELLRRRQGLPPVDPVSLRHDISRGVNPDL